VICNGAGETRLALSAAVAMLSGLDAENALIDPQPVPYPLALDRPDVAPAVTFRRLRARAASAGARPELFIGLCRDPLDGPLRILRRGAPVLLGIWRRMLPFSIFHKPERLAASLRPHGLEVFEVTCR
jgi:hypothetical protein